MLFMHFWQQICISSTVKIFETRLCKPGFNALNGLSRPKGRLSHSRSSQTIILFSKAAPAHLKLTFRVEVLSFDQAVLEGETFFDKSAHDLLINVQLTLDIELSQALFSSCISFSHS